ITGQLQWGWEELESEFPEDTPGEWGLLASHLNRLVRTLRHYRQRIQEERATLQAVLDSLRDALIVLDREGRVVLFNPAAASLLGTAELERGKYLLEVLRSHEIDKLLQEVLATGMPLELKARPFPTTSQIFKIYVTPIRNSHFLGAVLILQDITNIRRLEQMRTEFVANVSHELRTPLTSIRGFVETLLDGAWEDREICLHFLDIINREAQRLQQLIEDLLPLSQLENQPQSIKRGQCHFRPVAEAILATLKPRIEEKDLQVSLHIPPDLPPLAIGENYLSQVLLNLLDNAVKYTPSGGWIAVRARPLNKKVKVEVEDSSIGIPEESLPRVFERFYRVDKARSREMGGTGLGLSIVKHIVESHGGKVGVSSRLGKGSLFFFFTLPVAA
ncbi:MAG TPA: PAS domain S-box protein, partial [Moorella mulderi]|nr:PAS domain S-box protein [Moorella mulderi]